MYVLGVWWMHVCDVMYRSGSHTPWQAQPHAPTIAAQHLPALQVRGAGWADCGPGGPPPFFLLRHRHGLLLRGAPSCSPGRAGVWVGWWWCGCDSVDVAWVVGECGWWLVGGPALRREAAAAASPSFACRRPLSAHHPSCPPWHAARAGGQAACRATAVGTPCQREVRPF